MAYTTEYTKQELIKRFTENNWEALDLEMKTGDFVRVTPCFYGDDIPTKPEDCEWFLMDCATINLCGSDKIEDVANQLNSFADDLVKDAKEKDQLADFYDKHLAWATADDRQKAYDAHGKFYDYFIGSGLTWDETEEKHLPDVAKDLGMTLEDAKKYLGLSMDFSWYSDWHKDLYGYRPR